MVSGTISLPSRGTFHHSLTVLSTIGHTEYLGLPGGPGRFTADSTSPLLLGDTNNQPHTIFSYRTLTFSGRPSQTTSPNNMRIGTTVVAAAHQAPQHRTHNPYQVSHAHGLASSTFVRHY